MTYLKIKKRCPDDCINLIKKSFRCGYYREFLCKEDNQVLENNEIYAYRSKECIDHENK